MNKWTKWTAVLLCAALLAGILGVSTSEAAPSSAVTLGVDITWSAWSSGWWGAPPAFGTFSSTGAIADSGSASAFYAYWFGGAPPRGLWLSGSNGTLYVVVSGNTWTIQSGTGAYANATGGGSATVTTTTYGYWGYVYGYRFQFALTGSVS